LREINTLAAEQLRKLKSALTADDTYNGGLADDLQRLAREYHGQLQVDLVTSQLSVEPPADVEDALVGATREALLNVLKHAGVSHAVVHAADLQGGVEIVVRDHGSGFEIDAGLRGFGLKESIRQRMHEVGGEVEITSRTGKGTRVRLWASTLKDSQMPSGILSARRALRTSESTSEDVLTNRAIGWFVVAALFWRVLLSPLLVINAYANFGSAVKGWFLVMMLIVLVGDTLLMVCIPLPRVQRLLGTKLLLLIDLGAVAVLNLAAVAVLPAGTAMLPGREVFWGYAMGAVVLWTALRGPRTGAAIVAGALALQFAMAAVNHSPLSEPVLWGILSRQSFVTASFLLAWLLTALARQRARRAVTEGIRAGRAIERAWSLRDLYAGVTDNLGQIVNRSTSEVPATQDALIELRGLALAQIDEVRAALQDEGTPAPSKLISKLHLLASEVRARGLRVELVTAELSADPPSAVVDALMVAVREALLNVVRRAEVSHVVVRAADVDGGLEIVVRDQGRGFKTGVRSHEPGFEESVQRRMQDIGGDVDVWSEPGRGTRVRISWVKPISAKVA
jgi:signal transduction histidine kinase